MTNPQPGSTYTFSIALEDRANAGLWKAAPTIVAGDLQRSINGGAFANLDNLPTVTPAAGRLVQIVLSADETTAAGEGGRIDIVGHDASGDEWYDVGVSLRVGAPAVNVTHHAGVAVAAADANGNVPVVLYGTQPAVTFGQVKIAANVSGQGALDVRNSSAYGHGLYADGGNFGLRTQGSNGGQGNFGTYYGQVNSGATGAYNSGSTANVEGVDEAGIRAALGMAAADLDTQLAAIGIDGQDVADALLLAPSGVAAAGSAMDYLADIVDDTGTTLPGTLATLPADIDTELTSSHGAGSWAGGGGAGSGTGTGYYSDTVESPGGTPVDGARVMLATDEDGDNVAYEARTDAFGVFEMRPDPGTYYRFIEAAGHTFTQGVEVLVEEA